MRGNLLKLETDVIIENATNEGLTRGRTEERENGIRIMISALKPYTTHEQITKQLIQSYNLSLNQAEAYIRKYTLHSSFLHRFPECIRMSRIKDLIACHDRQLILNNQYLFILLHF